MAKTTHVAVAPDGTELSLKTDCTYSHAVVLEGQNGWAAVGFRSRRDLAEKECGEHPGSTEALGAEAAETATPAVAEKSEDQARLTVGATVKRLLTETDLEYAEIVEQVLAAHPDARTTARSVASVASTLRKKGMNVPMRRLSKSATN